MTAVCLYRSPFDEAHWMHGLPGNMSVAALLRHVNAPLQVWTHGRVDVGGVPVPPDWWDRVKVKADSWVTVRVVPKGGGGGGGSKDLIATIGTIALIAGAAFISAGALAPLGVGLGFSLAAGSFGAQALALGFSVVGQLALSALTAPPVAPNVDAGASLAAREIAGVTGNPLGRREYLPSVLGTMRASPPHVMWPYTELVNGEVVANAMFGLAGKHAVNDIQIAGAPIEDFDGVDYDVSNDDTPIALFGGKSAIEQSVGETLSEWQLSTVSGETDWTLDQSQPQNSYPKWKSFKTRGPADQVDIRLFWPSGILSNNTDAGAQMMVIQFRSAGASTWINGPEFWWSDVNAKPTQKRQHIRLIWDIAPSGLVATNNDTWAWTAYGDTPESWQWKPASYFAPGSGYYADNVNITDDGFDVYLDPATYPKGQYEIRIKRGLQITRSFWSKSTYVWDGTPSLTRWYDTVSSSSPWEAANNQDNQAGPCVMETFLTRCDDYPVNQDGLTLIGVQAKGVRIDQLSALFTSIVPDWTGAAWVDAETTNPASLYRHVLISALNSKPLPESVIDDAALQDWHSHCDTEGYECNAVIQNYSVDQTKQLIASAGWALPQQSDKWGVVIERDLSATAPAQLFSQRNTRGLTVEKSFNDLPHAIVAEFYDEDDDYNASETVVYFPGYSALNATLFETVRYDGITNRAKVRDRAELDRDQLIYRQKRYVFEADVAHLVSPRGTLVALSNDMLGTIYDSARIVEVLDDGGGNITGFVLDAAVNIEAAPLDVFSVADVFALADVFADSATSGAVIQENDGSTLTLEIDETADTDTITLTTPIADPGTIVPGLLVAVGRLDREVKRCRVFSVDRVKDLMARITLVDEAPELHAA